MVSDRAWAPHSHGKILHAPGTCVVCDQYPDLQELRRLWRINFTGQMEAGKTPCPSHVDNLYGAMGAGVVIPKEAKV